MAENTNSFPLELGAEMDYQEHERTYTGFITIMKWAAIILVALLLAMAFGFFVAGPVSAGIVFILVCIAAWYLL